MAAKTSAGILLHRTRAGVLEVLLVHPGGPFWAKKDEWFLPKGEIEAGEQGDLLATARREFREELGQDAPATDAIALGTVTTKSRKLIHAWAIDGDLDVTHVQSNTFTMEWPPRSGKQAEFPEVDAARYFTLAEAKLKMHEAERAFLDRLESAVRAVTAPG